LSDPGEGDYDGVDGEQRVREKQSAQSPSTAERRAFKLLPLVWIGAVVLGAVILYLVFR
jgi:hypothetical protein